MGTGETLSVARRKNDDCGRAKDDAGVFHG